MIRPVLFDGGPGGVNSSSSTRAARSNARLEPCDGHRTDRPRSPEGAGRQPAYTDRVSHPERGASTGHGRIRKVTIYDSRCDRTANSVRRQRAEDDGERRHHARLVLYQARSTSTARGTGHRAGARFAVNTIRARDGRTRGAKRRDRNAAIASCRLPEMDAARSRAPSGAFRGQRELYTRKDLRRSCD